VNGLFYDRQALSEERLMRRMRLVVVLVSVVAALAWTGTALAGDAGLVDEYTEQVPTASGPTGTGHGGGGTGGATLPGSVQTQITQEGGKDSKLLKAVATSARYGAPNVQQLDQGPPVVSSSQGALSAAVTAVSDGSDGRMIGLFIALLVTAAAMLGIGAARHTRRART
jgi:hypothetical protein